MKEGKRINIDWGDRLAALLLKKSKRVEIIDGGLAGELVSTSIWKGTATVEVMKRRVTVAAGRVRSMDGFY